MNKRMWMKDPARIQPFNSSKLLPTTCKILKTIVSKYHKSSKPSYRFTEFIWVCVVGRILGVSHKNYDKSDLVLTDNTDIIEV